MFSSGGMWRLVLGDEWKFREKRQQNSTYKGPAATARGLSKGQAWTLYSMRPQGCWESLWGFSGEQCGQICALKGALAAGAAQQVPGTVGTRDSGHQGPMRRLLEGPDGHSVRAKHLPPKSCFLPALPHDLPGKWIRNTLLSPLCKWEAWRPGKLFCQGHLISHWERQEE